IKERTGKLLGVVQCLNKNSGIFDEEDEAMLAALAAQAGVAIQNHRFFAAMVQKNAELLRTKQELERRVRELDVLTEIAHVAASSLSLNELLDRVLECAIRAVGAEAGAILIADPRTGDLCFRSAVGGASDRVKSFRIPRGQGIGGWVIAHQLPKVVNDVTQEPLYFAEIASRVGYWPRSILAVPLSWRDPERELERFGGEGVLELLNKGHGGEPFTEDDLRFATLIGSQISTAIQLAEARERERKAERLSTVGQLLSSVLHDLRTPMAVISGCVHEMVESDSKEERKALSATVLRQVEFINAMTKETLAFARGDRAIWIRKVHLKPFFQELVAQLKKELEPAGVLVELELKGEGTASFDQPKIQRAIHNLARNAAEAILAASSMQNGANLPIGSFLLRVECNPTGLLIECEDDGPGIPDAIRERLFESFATYGKEGGTGLGLAIVRKVVEDHGGSIEVESRPGRTVFRMRLPQEEGCSGCV
ncbi:MAG: GAF domain-containing sensor histidine kinase, partial [Deltaproteobacteria bacterium]|nr:GAF domain-containing sensor histidine kinase [Deltaproteobacteria bacterium]